MKIDQSIKICVVGLGYIGLPTAAVLGSRGYQIHGVEINPKALRSLTRVKPTSLNQTSIFWFVVL